MKKKPREIRRDRDAVVTVSRQVRKDAPVRVTEHRLAVYDLPEHVAEIGVGRGFTKSIGPYESARYDVHVHVPCLPTKSSMRKAKAAASELVTEFLDEEERILGLD